MVIAVCDDLPEAIQDLQKKLLDQDKSYKIQGFQSLSDFEASIRKKNRFDVCFMDIDWGNEHMNGIDFVESLKGIPVIFVTAYPIEFAEEIFTRRFRPDGFLIKPVKEEQLRILLGKIKKNQEENKRSVVVSIRGEIRRIAENRIMYAEGVLHKTRIHLVNQESIEIAGGLGTNQKLFPSHFISCHKSFLVNATFIKSFAASRIQLQNGEEIPVSRAKSNSARAQFIEYAKDRL